MTASRMVQSGDAGKSDGEQGADENKKSAEFSRWGEGNVSVTWPIISGTR